MRPGSLCQKGTGYADGEGQTLPAPGVTGVMGEFDAVAPPGIESFGTSAVGATAAGALLLQRVDAKAGGCGCGGACGCNGACGGA